MPEVFPLGSKFLGLLKLCVCLDAKGCLPLSFHSLSDGGWVLDTSYRKLHQHQTNNSLISPGSSFSTYLKPKDMSWVGRIYLIPEIGGTVLQKQSGTPREPKETTDVPLFFPEMLKKPQLKWIIKEIPFILKGKCNLKTDGWTPRYLYIS